MAPSARCVCNYYESYSLPSHLLNICRSHFVYAVRIVSWCDNEEEMSREKVCYKDFVIIEEEDLLQDSNICVNNSAIVFSNKRVSGLIFF